MNPVKASPIDDDAFRLLAFPFSGPIPHPGTRGVDVDGQWFSAATDIKADWLPFRPTDWHHGNPHPEEMRRRGGPVVGRTVLGKAVDIGRFEGPSREPDDEGWWVTVWLDAGEKRLDLVRRLADRGAQLFGSSETLPGVSTVKASLDGPGYKAGDVVPWRPGIVGEIMSWPYWRQTLSSSPQNTHSVIRPLKATLDEIEAAGERPSASFWTDVEDALRSLGHSLRTPSGTGGYGAKAGRAVDTRESVIREALASLNSALDRTSAILEGRDRDHTT